MSTYATTLVLKVDRPRPRTLLNRGAAKHPVKAISANPFFAIEVLAMKSPIEFPHARIVNPRSVGGKPDQRPKIFSKSIRICAVDQIQKTLIAKENS
jgi:hypothetical protein